MRQRMKHAVRHPLRLAVTVAALACLIALVARAAYAQGVRHAITTAQVWAEDDVYLVDFDGEVYEYR